MIDEKRIKTRPIQHIRNLMDGIKEGNLAVTYYDPIDPPYTRDFEVSCTASDADEVVAKYETLTQVLEEIAMVRRELESGAKIEDHLTSKQIAVWSTYIRDFDEKFDAGEFELDDIYEMRACGAQLSDEEQEVLERHYEWFEEQCLKRLPKKAYSSMYLLNRARRYEYLISQKAPEIVVAEEGRCLAEEMILYYFGKENR